MTLSTDAWAFPSIDGEVPENNVENYRHISTLIESPGVEALLLDRLEGSRSKEFYEGLRAGFYNADTIRREIHPDTAMATFVFVMVALTKLIDEKS
jgi:hypothetical protein